MAPFSYGHFHVVFDVASCLLNLSNTREQSCKEIINKILLNFPDEVHTKVSVLLYLSPFFIGGPIVGFAVVFDTCCVSFRNTCSAIATLATRYELYTSHACRHSMSQS